MSERCVECGARCCRYFCFEIDTPDTYEEYENIRWFLCHEGVSVHIDDGDWYISIANRCKMLGENDRCIMYEKRPLICRKYAVGNCDFTQGGYEYEALFELPEQVEAYGKRKLGKRRWALEEKAAMDEIEEPTVEQGPIDLEALMKGPTPMGKPPSKVSPTRTKGPARGQKAGSKTR
jgi:Fe-S-cluster containining protein